MKGEERTSSRSVNTERGRFSWAVISKYFLLTMGLSLIGWAYEVTFMFLRTGRFEDSGFMTMPFCPIYGCSLIATYFLLGTPDEGRGLMKSVHSAALRYMMYATFAFLIPTAAELFVGLFFDKVLGATLWSYENLPLNYHGYVSLPVSLAWMGMIFLFMKFLFLPIKKLFFRIPDRAAVVFATLLFVATIADVAVNYALAWRNRM